MSFGIGHAVAILDTGELYGWGSNDCQQIVPISLNSDVLITEPMLIPNTTDKRICGKYY